MSNSVSERLQSKTVRLTDEDRIFPKPRLWRRRRKRRQLLAASATLYTHNVHTIHHRQDNIIQLVIRSVERGICPIAKSIMTEQYYNIIMAGCIAHARNAHSTSGLKSNVTVVFLDSRCYSCFPFPKKTQINWDMWRTDFGVQFGWLLWHFRCSFFIILKHKHKRCISFKFHASHMHLQPSTSCRF